MASADWDLLSNAQIYALNVVNLNAVITDTPGDAVDVRQMDKGRVFIEVTGNTGAVTVKVEGSPTGLFAGEETELFSTIYTATNTNDVFNILYPLPFIRTTTTSHANSTVKTTITGRS